MGVSVCVCVSERETEKVGGCGREPDRDGRNSDKQLQRGREGGGGGEGCLMRKNQIGM